MRFYYFEMVGTAVFAITGVLAVTRRGPADKVLSLHLSPPVAVTMGVLTGIGGGLIRDVLAGRPTLLMSREIYATPILMGCIAFVFLRGASPPVPYAGMIGFTIIFGVRALAIDRHLEMPVGSRIGTHPTKPFCFRDAEYMDALISIGRSGNLILLPAIGDSDQRVLGQPVDALDVPVTLARKAIDGA